MKVGVCSLTNQEFKYIDHNSYPDMPVSTGLVASSSIPFIFPWLKLYSPKYTNGYFLNSIDLKFKYFDEPLQFEIGKLEENVAKYVST